MSGFGALFNRAFIDPESSSEPIQDIFNKQNKRNNFQRLRVSSFYGPFLLNFAALLGISENGKEFGVDNMMIEFLETPNIRKKFKGN